MTTALTKADEYLAQMEAGRRDSGAASGGDGTFLRRTKSRDEERAVLVYGRENIPWDPEHRVAIGLLPPAPVGFLHGYIEVKNKSTVVGRSVVPMLQPLPRPPGGYAPYPEDGARKVMIIEADSIDEPGLKPSYTAWGVSDVNRMDSLLGLALAHAKQSEGREGFLHPVITMFASFYYHDVGGVLWQGKEHAIWHWDFKLVDWLHADGKTLLGGGERPKLEVRTMASDDDEEPPFDADDLLS